MTRYLIGVYVINITLHGRLQIRNFSSRVRSLVKYFSTLEEKFRICARLCNILYFPNDISERLNLVAITTHTGKHQ